MGDPNLSNDLTIPGPVLASCRTRPFAVAIVATQQRARRYCVAVTCPTNQPIVLREVKDPILSVGALSSKFERVSYFPSCLLFMTLCLGTEALQQRRAFSLVLATLASFLSVATPLISDIICA